MTRKSIQCDSTSRQCQLAPHNTALPFASLPADGRLEGAPYGWVSQRLIPCDSDSTLFESRVIHLTGSIPYVLTPPVGYRQSGKGCEKYFSRHPHSSSVRLAGCITWLSCGALSSPVPLSTILGVECFKSRISTLLNSNLNCRLTSSSATRCPCPARCPLWRAAAASWPCRLAAP